MNVNIHFSMNVIFSFKSFMIIYLLKIGEDGQTRTDIDPLRCYSLEGNSDTSPFFIISVFKCISTDIHLFSSPLVIKSYHSFPCFIRISSVFEIHSNRLSVLFILRRILLTLDTFKLICADYCSKYSSS